VSRPAPAIGERSAPRFEFRSFGQHFEGAHYRMARLSAPVPEALWERHAEEQYLVSRVTDRSNAKIRNGRLDIKTLVGTRDGLEQWAPVLDASCPLPAQLLREEFFPAVAVATPDLPSPAYGEAAFLELIQSHPDLLQVRVRKCRLGYLVHDTICEYGEVLINGARVATISAESLDPDRLRQTLRDVGLEGVENINYVQAIKRVVGMIRKPLANE
jgi:hypothetical protein